LLLPAEELLIECVDAGELLVGHFARNVLLKQRDETTARTPGKNC
jgi:hypothetical protein